MTFLNIKDPVERDAIIEALKNRLKERNMEEHGYLSDGRRDLEETFEPIVANYEKMARDIIWNPLMKDYMNWIEILRSRRRNVWHHREEANMDCLLLIMDLSRKHLFENMWIIQWKRCLIYASRMENAWDHRKESKGIWWQLLREIQRASLRNQCKYDPWSSYPGDGRNGEEILHPIWEDFQHEGIAPSN